MFIINKNSDVYLKIFEYEYIYNLQINNYIEIVQFYYFMDKQLIKVLIKLYIYIVLYMKLKIFIQGDKINLEWR